MQRDFAILLFPFFQTTHVEGILNRDMYYQDINECSDRIICRVSIISDISNM